jgi:hypothetical protein
MENKLNKIIQILIKYLHPTDQEMVMINKIAEELLKIK